MENELPMNLSCRIIPRRQRSPEEQEMLADLEAIAVQNQEAKESINILASKEVNPTVDELRAIQMIYEAAEVRAFDVLTIRRLQ